MGVNVQVQLSSLPTSILSQIPVSLRHNKTWLIYNDLPMDIQLLLREYSQVAPPSITPVGVYDYGGDFSSFGDWVEYKDLASLIISYMQNWLLTRYGSYPFDPLYGTKIYSVLHMKDTIYQTQLLKNELATLNRLIVAEFSTNFTVTKQSVIPIQYTDRTEYSLELQIKVLGRTTTLNVST